MNARIALVVLACIAAMACGSSNGTNAAGGHGGSGGIGGSSGGSGGSGGEAGSGGSGGSGGEGGSGGTGGEEDKGCQLPAIGLPRAIDDAGNLLIFDPRQLGTGNDPFSVEVPLGCAASSTPVQGWTGGVQPFSLTVDRLGAVWVLYTSGEIFQVTSAGNCVSTSFAPSQGSGAWRIFDLAFVNDGPDLTTEKLYVTGGNPDDSPGQALGLLDTSLLTISKLGNLPQDGEHNPEISGSSDGTLLGFYPGSSTAFVQHIDKTTGAAAGNKINIPGAVPADALAWASTRYGGKAYVFITQGDPGNPSTSVHTLDLTTGAYDVPASALKHTIIAAGVSTCAPSHD